VSLFESAHVSAREDSQDPVHAREVTCSSFDERVATATTTALVFCTVHRVSVQACFQAVAAAQAHAHGLQARY